MQKRKRFMAVLLGVGLAGVSLLHGQTTGDVTWKGEGTTAHWNVAENWVGDEAPANPTPGEITFGTAGQAVPSIVETDRGVYRLRNTDGTTHTINLGGNMLTISSMERCGWGRARRRSATPSWAGSGPVRPCGRPAIRSARSRTPWC